MEPARRSASFESAGGSRSPARFAAGGAAAVKDIGPRVTFYETILGFSVVSRDLTAAVLTRDGVRIGLIRKADHQPNQAGSIAFLVDDLDALHRELRERGGKPGEFGVDEWGGKQHRTFFVREDENGYCYCFYHRA